MAYIDLDALGIGKANPAMFENRAFADGWNSLYSILQQAPVVDAAQNWISVKDRMPEELFRAYLVYCPAQNNTYEAYLNARGEWHFVDYFCGRIIDEPVTYWMPLPEPPKEE